MLTIVGIEKGIDVVYSADIPLSSAGVGLASSSALAVGALNALYTYKGIYATPELLAEKACEIEIDRLYNPIGIQDQYAVAYGGMRRDIFWNDGKVSANPLRCSRYVLGKLKGKLMLFYTGLTRISGEILFEQKNNISNKQDVLDSMNDMVSEAEDYLRNGNVDALGEMLDRAWQYKRCMASRISNPEIEEMYDKAKKAGAEGGKILGAGGGGFLLLFVPEEKQRAVRNALSGYQEAPFNFEPEGSRIIFVEDNR